MNFNITGSYNGTASSESFSYMVTSTAGGIYNVSITSGSASQSVSFSFQVDTNNDTVLSATITGYTITGSQAKTEFDDIFALFGLEYTYGGALNLYTSSSFFHATGTAPATFGTTTFSVTTYEANTIPETINECGVSTTLNAYTLGVGTPPGTTLQFITYLHIAGTDSSGSFEDTFQLVSMTVA